jgi:hypothetical protein
MYDGGMDENPYASPSPTPVPRLRFRRTVGIVIYVLAALFLIDAVAQVILVKQLAEFSKSSIGIVIAVAIVKAVIGLALLRWGRCLRRPDATHKIP